MRQYGITVNAVAPGLTVTSATLATTDPAYIERRAQEGCLKRPQQPADLVGTFVYLASDASAFVTGQTLVVDGGRVFW